MKNKPAQTDELKMKTADFEAMMRKALGVSAFDANAAKSKEKKAPAKKRKG